MLCNTTFQNIQESPHSRKPIYLDTIAYAGIMLFGGHKKGVIMECLSQIEAQNNISVSQFFL